MGRLRKASEGERATARVAEHRRQLANDLYHDLRRKGGHGDDCEGLDYRPHKCSGSLQLNEVLFPRNTFQTLPLDVQTYFFDKINCSLSCGFFHTIYGHRSAYRDWHRHRMEEMYGAEAVATYVEGAPLMVKTPKGTGA